MARSAPTLWSVCCAAAPATGGWIRARSTGAPATAAGTATPAPTPARPAQDPLPPRRPSPRAHCAATPPSRPGRPACPSGSRGVGPLPPRPRRKDLVRHRHLHPGQRHATQRTSTAVDQLSRPLRPNQPDTNAQDPPDPHRPTPPNKYRGCCRDSPDDAESLRP